jgi:predicted lipoprotein
VNSRYAVLTVGLMILASGCGPRFDRSAMLDGIGQTLILPAHEALLREATRLDSTAIAFAAGPTAEGLGELRAQWLTTEIAWREVALFQFEGLLILHNAIEKRPARGDFIEETIESRARGERSPIDAAFIKGAGATSKGLGAIEYLLYPPLESPAAIAAGLGEGSRSEYLLALTGSLVETVAELLDYWAPSGQNYLATFAANDSDGADLQGSISRLGRRFIRTEWKRIPGKAGCVSTKRKNWRHWKKA